MMPSGSAAAPSASNSAPSSSEQARRCMPACWTTASSRLQQESNNITDIYIRSRRLEHCV
eukprot:774566-Pelagomonas_calceolata.AAC.1